jgi:hypothetical protein
MDPAARLRKVDLVMRITDRAVRTWPLNEWALLRRILPDGDSSQPEPWRFIPHKGSSLGFDDLAFMPEIGERLVSSTARFPVMSATENLVGAAQAHGAAFQQGRTNIASVATLCRCALESAAKTIWLLAAPTRQERQARCLGFIQSERQPQQGFMKIEQQVLTAQDLPLDSPPYRNYLRHRADYDKRAALIAAVPKEARKKPPTNYSDIVAWSAKWVDANPPLHATNQLSLGMALAADRFYSYASSFVHGFKWMTDYIHDDEDSLRMLDDGFAAAVIMTECAVALFEAQATHPAKAQLQSRNYPKSLLATVIDWSPRYWET